MTTATAQEIDDLVTTHHLEHERVGLGNEGARSGDNTRCRMAPSQNGEISQVESAFDGRPFAAMFASANRR